ncbi:membrane protein [Paenibacillus sp. J31TS4]|uniref:HupE/UreJ family protein n=1 Tax=Paenibacillus sp. J31TS4 TaxID=2807195 RepID=UPI001B2B4C66|nr:HupE/UreJ family protein [Paenibacillus sp. J31TS4]GIP41138.1 membrane protein [Paenibacillus sp. J31TS4]
MDYELFMPEMAMLVFDMNRDGAVTWDEVDAQRAEEEAYLREHLTLLNEETPMRMELVSVKPEKKEYAGFTFSLRYVAEQPVKELMLHYNLLFDDLDPTHLSQLLISDSGNLEQGILSANSRTFHYASDRPHSFGAAFRAYLLLGIEHIWGGADHLLFLFALLLIVTRVKDAVGIVTAFTAAHSITLFLAATDRISFEPRWIEALIALSIGYVAVENLLGQSVRVRWAITFGFGLIHGLGFAGALGDIGLPPAYLLSSLLAFNLGVEAGQLVLVAAALPLLLLLRRQRWHRYWLRGASCLVLAVSLYWVLDRLGWLPGLS